LTFSILGAINIYCIDTINILEEKMRRKISKLFAGIVLGVIMMTGVAQAATYDNGNFSITCNLSVSGKKATGSTNGAPGGYYNRVAVYARNNNGVSLKSAYSLKYSGSVASAKTAKASKMTYADSYHYVSNASGASIEPYYKQVRLYAD